jgi:hypothetical protein
MSTDDSAVSDTNTDASSIVSVSYSDSSAASCSDSDENLNPTKRLRMHSESSTDEEAIFLSDSSTDSTVSTVSSQEELEKIAGVLISKCCDNLCTRDLTVNDILIVRSKFSNLNITEQRQWLADKIIENSSSIDWKTKYIVAGKEVCRESFCLVHNFSPKRLFRIRKEVTQGCFNYEHGNKGKKKETTRVNEVKTWMNRYFKLIGDKLPDKDQIHLPSWDTQKAIYQRYKDDMMRMGMYIACILHASLSYHITH